MSDHDAASAIARSERAHSRHVRRDRRHARRRLRRDRCADRADVAQRRACWRRRRRGSCSPTPTGHLRVMAASTEQIELLELFQIQNDEGPCLDCFHTGAVVVHGNLEGASPWPQFAAESVRAGYPSVCAVPLRLKDVILGCLNLFMSQPVSLAGRRCRTRPGTCRRRQHRHHPGPGHTRSRDPRRPAAARVEQPHRDRAGQGHDRRTRLASTWTPPSRSCGGSPGTTTVASPRSRERS